MNLAEIARRLGLRLLTPELEGLERIEIATGHVSDLLSDVLAHAPAGGLLITIQAHLNVVAVAVHAGLAGIIFSSGMVPEDGVRQKAVEEKIPLFATAESSFDLVGRLYGLGLRGGDW